MIVRRLIHILAAGSVVLLLSPSSLPAQTNPYRISLNGLEFAFDRDTGVLVSLSHRVTGQILKSNAASGGMLEGLFGSSGLLELEIEPPAQDQPKTKPPI